MKNFLLSIIFLIAGLCHLSAQTSSRTQISLLTCDQGEALYSTFGHSAIRVNDPVTRFDQVYNYGTFNAFEDNFYIKFLRGKLNYKLSRYSYGKFLQEYHREKRSVIEQPLQLDSASTQDLVQFLEWNNQPENQYYLYDFFFDNCSSIIRDIAENELPGFHYQDTIIPSKTFRNLLDEHLGELPWSDFGIDLIIGAGADRVASFREQMFLPVYLSAYLDRAYWQNNGKEVKLLKPSYTVLSFQEEEVNAFTLSPALLFWLILTLEILISFYIFKNNNVKWPRIYEGTVFLLAGLAGLLMLFMWFGTDHIACGNNWNVLWANPLFVLLAFLHFRGKESKYIRYLLMACLALSLVGWSLIPQAYHLAFIPIILWLLLLLLRPIFRKSMIKA